MIRLVMCETCAGGAGPGLARAVATGVPGVTVETAACLNLCDRPVAFALTGPGRDAYLFAGAEAGDAPDLVALVGLYVRAAPSIEDARPAGRLRHCLVGRIPAGGDPV